MTNAIKKKLIWYLLFQILIISVPFICLLLNQKFGMTGLAIDIITFVFICLALIVTIFSFLFLLHNFLKKINLLFYKNNNLLGIESHSPLYDVIKTFLFTSIIGTILLLLILLFSYSFLLSFSFHFVLADIFNEFRNLVIVSFDDILAFYVLWPLVIISCFGSFLSLYLFSFVFTSTIRKHHQIVTWMIFLTTFIIFEIINLLIVPIQKWEFINLFNLGLLRVYLGTFDTTIAHTVVCNISLMTLYLFFAFYFRPAKRLKNLHK